MALIVRYRMKQIYVREMRKMFCAVQELTTKKENKNGHPKRLEVYPETLELIRNSTSTRWKYRFSEERFERPVKKAYKITVHKSYREDGKVKAKQISICTLNYYDFVDGQLQSEKVLAGIKKAAKGFRVAYKDMEQIVLEKIHAVEKEVLEDFSQTEEYKTHKQHEQIIVEYEKRKKEFDEKYEYTDGLNRYDACYDIFGELKNPKRLEEIELEYMVKQRTKRLKEEYEQYEKALFEKEFAKK